MATTIENGIIVFGDGTQKGTANYAWSGSSAVVSGLTSVPTQLSQFTNDLGNYGGWLTTSNPTAGNTLSDPNNIINNCGSGRGGVGQRNNINYSMTWNGTKVGWIINNCNCACNC
jgi:hypothetical protein